MNTTKSLSAEIARVVRGLLAERQITVKEFAVRAGLKPSSVDRWLKRGGTYSVDALDSMASALGMTAGELVAAALGKRTDTPRRDEGEWRDTGS